MEETRLKHQKEKELRLQSGVSPRGRGRGRGGYRGGKQNRSKGMDIFQPEENGSTKVSDQTDEMDASDVGTNVRSSDQSATVLTQNSTTVPNDMETHNISTMS